MMNPADPQHLSWLVVFLPGVVVAAIISLDNKYVGPYFALADAVFNERYSEIRWSNRQIVGKLFRRACYLFISGVVLALLSYSVYDVVGVFLIAGFLLIWPAFLHPLPRYAKSSDWEVLCLWTFFVLSCVMFGLFGASVPAIVQWLSGHSPLELIRDDLLTALITMPASVILTSLWFPLQKRLEAKGDAREEPWR